MFFSLCSANGWKLKHFEWSGKKAKRLWFLKRSCVVAFESCSIVLRVGKSYDETQIRFRSLTHRCSAFWHLKTFNFSKHIYVFRVHVHMMMMMELSLLSVYLCRKNFPRATVLISFRPQPPKDDNYVFHSYFLSAAEGWILKLIQLSSWDMAESREKF